ERGRRLEEQDQLLGDLGARLPRVLPVAEADAHELARATHARRPAHGGRDARGARAVTRAPRGEPLEAAPLTEGLAVVFPETGRVDARAVVRQEPGLLVTDLAVPDELHAPSLKRARPLE